MKYIVTILFLLSLCFTYACQEDTENVSTGHDSPNIRLNSAALSPNALSNIQVYAFQGAGANNGAFSHRVFNINQTDNILAMVMPVNTWNFVLLSSEAGVLGAPIEPAVGDMRAAAKMWECPSDGSSLLSAPEIITARTGSIIINEGDHKYADISLVRNVAKLKLVIRDAAGLKTDGDHTVSLLNVPKSLTWDGGLYPDQTNPETSSLPMRASATIRNGVQGNQYSDTLEFIVPAHQGLDFLAGNPADTTTHKLTIAIDLEAQGGFRVAKSAVLDVVPKANKILVVNMSVSSTLNFDATIHDWINENHNVDISQTRLEVSKTNANLSWRDTVYVNTNAAAFYLTVGDGSWLSADKIDDNRVVLTANTASYVDGSPRSTYVDIRANNVTKRINVTQRPDVGTITAPESFWVSPSTGNTSRTITVNSTGPWQIVSGTPSNVLPGIYSGPAGNSNITFLRNSQVIDNGDYSIYGNDTIYLKNTQSLEIIPIVAQNLYMVFYDVTVGNASGVNTTTIDALNAICLGGSGTYTITSKPSWLTSATLNPDGTLTLVATGEPTGEPREGLMTFVHDNDPNYIITTKVMQDVVADYDPFAYFVVKFMWANGGDVDINVYFEDNYKVSAPSQHQAWDLKSVGFGFNNLGQDPGYVSKTGSVVKMGGKDTDIDMANFLNLGLLFWGGDNTKGGGETIFFNTPMIDNDLDVARFVKLVCKVWFYSASASTTMYPVRTSIYAYDGGTIIRNKNSYNFFSLGGTFIYGARNGDIIDYNFTNEQPINVWETAAIITYDKLKHSAKVQWGQKTSGTVVPVPKNEQ